MVLSTALISGFSIFINKYGVSFSNPFVYTFVKNALVAIILTSLFFSIKDFNLLKKINRKQWLNLVIIGLVGGSVPFLLFFQGLSMTSAAEGSFIHKSLFIFTSILSVYFLKERINKFFVLGAGMILLGNVAVIVNLSWVLGYGDFLIFLSVLFWSAENVLSKRSLRELDGKIVAWGRMFFGAVFILIFLFSRGQLKEISDFSIQQAGWAVLASVLLFFYVFTWYNGLKLVPLSTASSVLVLGSPITTFLSALAMGKISVTDIFSTAAILAGVIFILISGYLGEKIKTMKNYYGWS